MEPIPKTPHNPKHFNQEQRRQAEFITPPNLIKRKVGSGGLSDEILEHAQKLLEDNAVDFLPLAEIYLTNLNDGINLCQNPTAEMTDEYLISTLIYPAIQLRSNGSMFNYPLITAMADKMIHFLEVIDKPNDKVIEIIIAFYATIKMVAQARIQGEGGAKGRSLVKALDGACQRYFERYS